MGWTDLSDGSASPKVAARRQARQTASSCRHIHQIGEVFPNCEDPLEEALARAVAHTWKYTITLVNAPREDGDVVRRYVELMAPTVCRASGRDLTSFFFLLLSWPSWCVSEGRQTTVHGQVCARSGRRVHTAVLLVTGCLQRIRMLVQGDRCIGSGSRRRNLESSISGNPFKVAVHEAIRRCEDVLRKESGSLQGSIWPSESSSRSASFARTSSQRRCRRGVRWNAKDKRHAPHTPRQDTSTATAQAKGQNACQALVISQEIASIHGAELFVHLVSSLSTFASNTDLHTPVNIPKRYLCVTQCSCPVWLRCRYLCGVHGVVGALRGHATLTIVTQCTLALRARPQRPPSTLLLPTLPWVSRKQSCEPAALSLSRLRHLRSHHHVRCMLACVPPCGGDSAPPLVNSSLH